MEWKKVASLEAEGGLTREELAMALGIVQTALRTVIEEQAKLQGSAWFDELEQRLIRDANTPAGVAAGKANSLKLGLSVLQGTFDASRELLDFPRDK